MRRTPRWITRVGLLVALGSLVPVAAAAQQQAQQQAATRRGQLERQVLARFVDRAARELELDAGGRARLERVLRTSVEQRRALAEDATRLRQELSRALRDPATPDREFERLLAELAELRAREAGLWREEQEALAAVLTPRQRARFLLISARVNERIRALRGAGGEPVGPPP
jgi:Spy/CpxP family protein refolding chaperone